MTLYVSDLDGTLLDRSGRLSDRTRAGLTRMLDEGLLFTVASARHVSSIRHLLGDLPLRLPVISTNGACISELATCKHELVHAMEPALAQEVFALIVRLGLTPFFATHGPRGDHLFHIEAQNHGQRRFIEERIANRDPRLCRTERLQDELIDPAVTFVVVDREGPLQALEAEIEARFGARVECHLADDLYQPGWFWLTVHDRRATKDQAIKTLAERYGLHEREIVVFGDQINDVGMMRAAHRGIAMANAIDELKRHAHQVIGHHDEDSVLRFIEADWLRSQAA